MINSVAISSWSPAQQRAYQQGYNLALHSQSEAGLANKPAPPLSIRHDPDLLYPFEQGYQAGLLQPQQRRYRGIMPWTRVRQLLFIILIILAGLLVMVIMAPNDNHSIETSAQAAKQDPPILDTVHRQPSVPVELEEFALLTAQERKALLALQNELAAFKTDATKAGLDLKVSFELLIDEYGLSNGDACRAVFIWPNNDYENFDLIWHFNGQKHSKQNFWQEAFIPHTIGIWGVLFIENDIPFAYLSFYYGGNTLELLE
ncbi:hypothetical protein [Thiomicrospira sp. ALE5]|uniref:hypothetical protein n=1 Tax=Thiomicrospira sp. ALE5 TaxID=748650 RepID=UPI0008ED14F3|nr:hypothetical protein [Thiomicrospira sp. ALE5]SFR61539.1 hypothetical protein SAMN03092900_1765 [Thiomicrospira sp. ALE5]